MKALLEKRTLLALIVMVSVATLNWFGRLDTTLAWLLGSLYAVHVLGEVLLDLNYSLRKRRTATVGGDVEIDLTPIADRLDELAASVTELHQNQQAAGIELPENLGVQLQAQSNAAALNSQALGKLMTKLDHIIREAGFKAVS